MKEKLPIFVAYAHKDNEASEQFPAWLDELKLHLEAIDADVQYWHDEKIPLGEDWNEKILEAVNISRAAVLLVSPHFLASSYVRKEELPRLLTRSSEGKLHIIPIYLRPCLSGIGLKYPDPEDGPEEVSLESLQAANSPTEALNILPQGQRDQVFVTVARDLQELALALQAQTEGSGPSGTAPGLPTNLPHRSQYLFQTRREVDKIRAGFDRLKAENAPRKVLLHGLGGVGKSEIAKEYAHRFSDRYTAVLWTKAGSPSELHAGIESVAACLGLPHEGDAGFVAGRVRDWLGQNREWLLVLDGVTDDASVRDVLPWGADGDVLFTSQSRRVLGVGSVLPIPVRVFDLEQAVEFLLERTGRKDGEPMVADLARELGCVPLALEQAGAFLHETQASFEDYYNSYRLRGLELLEQSRTLAANYSDPVPRAWRLSIDQVVADAPDIAGLLSILAFLRGGDVPVDIFSHYAHLLGPELSASLPEADRDPLALTNLLEPLFRFSLIRLDTSQGTLSINPLVQEVIRDGLGKEERGLWAGRAVRLVRQAFSPTQQTPTVRRLPAPVLVEHIRAALRFLDELEPSRERDENELFLQIALGPPLTASTGYGNPEIMETYSRALELCSQLDIPDSMFEVHRGLWAYYIMRAELAEATHLAQACAEHVYDPEDAAESKRVSGTTRFFTGEFSRGLEELLESVTAYAPEVASESRLLFAQDTKVASQSYAAQMLWTLGRPDSALAIASEAVESAIASEHPFSMAYALAHRALMHMYRGELEILAERAEELVRFSEEYGFPFWRAFGVFQRGAAMTQQDRVEEGVEAMKEGLAAHDATGSRLWRPYGATYLAQAYGALQRFKEGAALLASIESRLVSNPGWAAEYWRVLGRIRYGKGQEIEPARECCSRAVEIAREQGALSLELRAWTDLVRLTDDARAPLRECLASFEEGHETYDQRVATRLLD